ncbi:MAG: helix-turn-helix domain-containing protein [Pseudonocardiaceae bacterium]
MMQPPDVPAEFWVTDHMQDALATWNMGRVIAAYRSHPYHGRPMRQEIVAGWVGITQAQLSRVENGLPIKDLDKLIQWVRTLGVPAHLLWFKLPEQPPDQADVPKEDRDLAIICYGQQEFPEIDDVNRRELLRLLSMALQRPDLAEAALSNALSLNLSARRRGSVLTDLAMLGVQRRDVNELVTYANAALDTARQTGSGVIGRKLQGLQPHLALFLTNRQVRQLNREITTLTGMPA